jgi:hypothetical protein
MRDRALKFFPESCRPPALFEIDAVTGAEAKDVVSTWRGCLVTTARKELTMTTEVKGGGRQVLRNIVCIMSMGFVFPNALMEEDDRKAALAKNELKAKQA